jgi:threonine/homoserine/homoserine lactone efflux protein
MTLETWIAFCVLETVLCFTPGPAVLYVTTTALTRGTRAGLAGALGIVAGNTVDFGLSAFGVAAVILASSRLFTALTWIGAAYLVWVGLKMLLSRAGPSVAAERPPTRVPTALLRGFGVQAANPKALAFFVALLPQFIDPQSAVARQVLILGASSAVIELGVLAFYTWLAVRIGTYAGARWATLVNRVAGGCLLAAGARLALTRAP